MDLDVAALERSVLAGVVTVAHEDVVGVGSAGLTGVHDADPEGERRGHTVRRDLGDAVDRRPIVALAHDGQDLRRLHVHRRRRSVVRVLLRSLLDLATRVDFSVSAEGPLVAVRGEYPATVVHHDLAVGGALW